MKLNTKDPSKIKQIKPNQKGTEHQAETKEGREKQNGQGKERKAPHSQGKNVTGAGTRDQGKEKKETN